MGLAKVNGLRSLLLVLGSENRALLGFPSPIFPLEAERLMPLNASYLQQVIKLQLSYRGVLG